MKKLFLFYIFSVLTFLCACGEEEKISALQKEKQELIALKDSLSKKQNDLQKNSGLTLISDTVKAGDGLFQVLSRMNVSETERRAIVLSIQDSVELSKMRVGQVFHVLLDKNNVVQTFRFAENPATIHLLFKSDSGYVYKRPNKVLVRKHSIFEGSLLQGSTLDGMLRSVGIPGRMVGIVSGVLQCKVAFQLAQPGDKFRILLEESFFEDSLWIEGKVLFAEFDGKTVGHHEAFLYEDPDPKSSYNAHYTENGEALVFDGLRYPLDRLHVTSAYGSRIHPITGKRSIHHGIDYGSPTGTPVYAVAEGVVIVSGYDNLSGNKIAIRHRDGSSSWYLHLHTRAVSKGAHVNTRQVIGRVGNTGRSTGPHLHFGFKDERGRWMNPARKTMIATPKLEGERLARLKSQAKFIRSSLEETAAVTPQKAGDSDILVRTRTIQ